MSVLGAIATIAGGLLGRPKKVAAGDNRYSDIQGLMAAAKDFGWNPLTLLTNGQAIGPTVIDNSAFGNAVANAGMMLGEAMSARRAEKAKMEKLNQTQARLQKRLEAITLRAPVPGVYGRARMPADPEVYGGRTDSGVSAGNAGGRGVGGFGPAGAPVGLPPLVDVDPIDPRRGVDNKPVGNTTGFMVVDNPYVGKVYVPTLDGEEPVDLLDLPALGYVGAQLAYVKGRFMSYGGGRESRPYLTRDEAIRLRDERKAASGSPKRPRARPPMITVRPPKYSADWVL